MTDVISLPRPDAPPAREPDKLSDRSAIADLVARFDDAVNRKDASEFAALWTNDAIWEIGAPMPLHVQGRIAIVETWTNMVAGTDWLFRGSFVGVVDVTGETATGRWPCVETGTFKSRENLPARGYDNRALYEDQYAKRDGKWYFAHRRYLYIWLSNEKLPGGAVALGEELM